MILATTTHLALVAGNDRKSSSSYRYEASREVAAQPRETSTIRKLWTEQVDGPIRQLSTQVAWKLNQVRHVRTVSETVL